MHQKLNQGGTDKKGKARETAFREELSSLIKPYQNPLEVNRALYHPDPRLHQRYSFDDNGGGYKGL